MAVDMEATAEVAAITLMAADHAVVVRVVAQATESRTASVPVATSDALARTTGRCCLQIAKRLSATHRPGQTLPSAAA